MWPGFAVALSAVEANRMFSSQIQMNPPLKLTYSEKLNKLEKQYDILLVSDQSLSFSCFLICFLICFISLNPCSFQGRSRERQSHLENLQDFVSQATQELIWLNEKEEEEVAFDWSDRNSSISKKREYHTVRFDLFCGATFPSGCGSLSEMLCLLQDLMREMGEKEGVFKSVQNKGEQLICKNHPARATIEVSLFCLSSLVSIRKAEDFRL